MKIIIFIAFFNVFSILGMNRKFLNPLTNSFAGFQSFPTARNTQTPPSG